MKNIIVRVWVHNEQRMSYFDVSHFVSFLDNGKVSSVSGLGKDNDVMLYTGIEDKNGIKIYEGDVCYVKYHKHAEPDLKLYQHVVYRKGGFWLSKTLEINENDTFEETYSFCPISWADEIEVLGNIYEDWDKLDWNIIGRSNP